MADAPNTPQTPAAPPSETAKVEAKPGTPGKDAIVAEVRDLYNPEDLFGIDQETLSPEMYYRLGADNHQRQAALRAKGFRPVSRSADGVKMLTDLGGGAEEDLIRIGDAILMCCPLDLHLERREQVGQLTRRRLSAPEGQFRKKAKKIDAEVVTTKDMKKRR